MNKCIDSLVRYEAKHQEPILLETIKDFMNSTTSAMFAIALYTSRLHVRNSRMLGTFACLRGNAVLIGETILHVLDFSSFYPRDGPIGCSLS